MTKQELLRKIKEIKEYFLRADESLTFGEQAQELQEIFEKQEEYQAEIDKLEKQLENPSEYYAVYTGDDAKTYMQNAQNRLTRLEEERSANEAEIAQLRNQIREMDHEIQISEKVVRLGNQELEAFDTTNGTEKSSVELANDIEQSQKVKTVVISVQSYIDELNDEKAEIEQRLTVIEERNNQVLARQERYRELIENMELNLEQGAILDRNHMETDRSKLEQAKQALAAFDSRQIYLSFNCVNALESLEEDIRHGNLTKEEIIRRLEVIQDRAPFAPQDVSEEVRKNREAQRKYEIEQEQLEDKLVYMGNYTISATASEKINQDILALEIRQSEFEAQSKNNIAMITKYTNDKDELDRKIETYKQEIDLLENHISGLKQTLNMPLSKKQRRTLEMDMRTQLKNKQDLQKTLDETYDSKMYVEQQLSLAQRNQKRFPRLLDSIDKILQQKRTRLQNTNIDEYAKRMDEDRLHDITAGLAALKAREAFLTADIPNKFDTLFAQLKEQEFTPDKEKMKIGGSLVTFEQAQNSVIEKISQPTFKRRIQAFFATAAFVAACTVSVVLLTNQTKLQKNGFKKQIVKDFKDSQKLDVKLHVEDKFYNYETEPTPEVPNEEVVESQQPTVEETEKPVVEAPKPTNPPKEEKPQTPKPTPKPIETPTPEPTPSVVPILPEAPVIKEEEHKPSAPIVDYTPSVPVTTPSKEYTVNKGDTLIIETSEGKVAVDNSDGANYTDLEKDVSTDYTDNNTITGVDYNDKTSSIDVTVDSSTITPSKEEEEALNQQILDDYQKILEEMGIASDGRTK